MAYRRTPAVVSRLEDKRARILAAARSLVAEGGWRRAHIATVAETAGMATGTVYRYFPSKAELFAEVLTNVSRRERDVVAATSAGMRVAWLATPDVETPALPAPVWRLTSLRDLEALLR